MKAKKLPPRSSPTALAPASVWRLKMRKGISGASTLASWYRSVFPCGGAASGLEPGDRGMRLLASWPGKSAKGGLMADVSARTPVFSRGSTVLDYWLAHAEGLTVQPLGARVEHVIVKAPVGHAE